jgi:group I intron endonuclease
MSAPVRASRRKYHIIYKTTCLVTNKYYIGMHSTDDLNDGYMGSGQVLWKSIKKYGKEQHVCEVLEHLPNREELVLREEELVNPVVLKDELCMNLRTGGTGNYPGRPTKEETSKKLSGKGKEWWANATEEEKAIRLKMTTLPRTKEWLSKMSESQKGKKIDPEVAKRHSEKLKGRKQKPEDVAARVNGQLNSDKFKERYRPIIVDGITYQNGREAVAALGIHGSTLTNRLLSPNWLNYRYADTPEKDPALVSSRARGEYKRVD